jgi:hypothetical protein
MRLSAIGLIVTLAILAVPLPPKAQSPAKVPRIGWLSLGASSGNPYLLTAFRQGLRELGWVEGQNLANELPRSKLRGIKPPLAYIRVPPVWRGRAGVSCGCSACEP